MYLVYVLRSLKNKQLYIGLTKNLERRLKEHNQGYNKSTKGFRPFEILRIEQYPFLSKARFREKEFKKGYWRERFKQLSTAGWSSGSSQGS